METSAAVLDLFSSLWFALDDDLLAGRISLAEFGKGHAALTVASRELAAARAWSAKPVDFLAE